MRTANVLRSAVVFHDAAKWIALILLTAAAPISRATAADVGLDVDENKGEVKYVYPIALPAARGRNQPNIDLQYDSAGGSGVALSWSLPWSMIGYRADLTPPRFTYVTRDTKKPLVLAPAPRTGYAVDVEDAYMGFTQTAQGWEARDASGNTSYYAWNGATAGGRLQKVVDRTATAPSTPTTPGPGRSARSATTRTRSRRRRARSPATGRSRR